MRSRPTFHLGKKHVLSVLAALSVAVTSGMCGLVLASTGEDSGYRDDTHAALQSAEKVVAIIGAQGFQRINFKPLSGVSSVALDARRATFTVANSRNSQPTVAQDCDHGDLPVNRYPLRIEQQDRAAFVGGLFMSRVPQSSEWRVTYCNSAAITFDGSPNGVVDGVRIAGAWDAIRAGRGSPGLLVVNSWISDARDDAVENDFLQAATIRDTLIDGAFQGVSVKPRKDGIVADASGQQVTLSAVLLSLKEYSYKDGRRFGVLAKSEQRSPRLRVVNSVVAVDYSGGQSFPQYWKTGWLKLAGSSNNLFLWLSDAPIPDFVALPPSSFRVLRGKIARDAWTLAKSNWINCHPKLARLPSDPRSNPDACIPGTWGGFKE